MATSVMDERAKEKMDKARKYLRLFLNDTPELNLLLKDYETPPERIEFCIEMAISDWNVTAPIFRPITIAQYPSLYLLMHGAAIQALIGAGLFQTRNSLAYSSGGSSFQRFGKANEYLAWIQNFRAEYEAKKKEFKVSKNIAQGWGGANGLFSDYYYLAFW